MKFVRALSPRLILRLYSFTIFPIATHTHIHRSSVAVDVMEIFFHCCMDLPPPSMVIQLNSERMRENIPFYTVRAQNFCTSASLLSLFVLFSFSSEMLLRNDGISQTRREREGGVRAKTHGLFISIFLRAQQTMSSMERTKWRTNTSVP